MKSYRPFTAEETAEIRCALAGLRMSAADLIEELGERVNGAHYVTRAQLAEEVGA